jgi:lysyl-tRNA synthetase class 2
MRLAHRGADFHPEVQGPTPMTQGAPTPTRPWWHPERHADRRPALLARNRIQRSFRAWFEAEGFTETDPAALQESPGNEAHLHALATEVVSPSGGGRGLYLHTSPEFAMKKLLAAGERRIFAFAHVWRNREGGPRHASEFTMLEWYRAGEDYGRLMQDCAELLALAAQAAGASVLRHGGATCDPFARPERLGLAEAMMRHAGVDLLATLAPDGTPDRDALARGAHSAGLRTAPDDTWSDILSRILVARVEPHLGMGRATLLDRYPAVEAALARRCPDDPRLAERFEFYVCGVELANGFGELTDPDEQRRRFEAEMDEKARVYGERYPLDEEFLAALALMPPASGIALGFDRLVMLATGAPRIADVLWAPPAG